MWAKSETSDIGIYHPLLFHSIDVSAVALELLKNRISPGKMQFWKACFPSIPIEQSIKLLAFLTSLHDIGKATPLFQTKNKILKDNLQLSGFSFEFMTLNTDAIRHNYFSQMLFREEFADITERLFEKNSLNKIANSIGGHHGEFARTEIMRKITKKVLGQQLWVTERKQLFNALFNLHEIQLPTEPYKISVSIKPLVFQYWLTGFITLVDWIASISYYFPVESRVGVTETRSVQEYFSVAQTRAEKALEGIGFSISKEPGAIPGFQELFNGYEPRVQQNEIFNELKNTNLSTGPCLIIIEAPMGIGKTEAAFTASEIINLERSHAGTYIAMPTQATSNQMYLRYKDFLESRLPSDYKGSFELLHSSSEFFLTNSKSKMIPENISPDNNEQNQAVLEAHTWFKSKKRGLLAPYAVGTIDQVLISVIRTKHNYLRLYGLNSKTIILDEVHSYDVYMSTILQRLLAWARRLDISVILLSATLPKKKLNELIEAYCGRVENYNAAYPRMIIATEGTIRNIALTPPSSKSVTLLRERFIDTKSILRHIALKINKGGCIGIICNTVKKAQEIYYAFNSSYEFQNIPSLLLHARFPADLRNEIENKVISLFGKTDKRPDSMVLFSTQIIEQSLDLDFDYMISDLCPIDLLMQRFGRLHRFQETKRPECFASPMITWIDQDDVFFESGKRRGPYSPYVLYKTRLSLKTIEHISIPEDIEPLIEDVYGDGNPKNMTANESEILSILLGSFKSEQESEIVQAEQKLIPLPDTEEEQFMSDVSLLDDDDPSTHPQIIAATRLGRPSVRVVCVTEQNGRLVLANKNNDPFQENGQLDDSSIRAILSAVVPLSGDYICSSILKCKETEPPVSWKRNSALRYLRVIKFLDGQFICGTLKINYNTHLGIFYGSNFICEG